MVNEVSRNIRYDFQGQKQLDSSKNDTLFSETQSDKLLFGSSRMADSLNLGSNHSASYGENRPGAKAAMRAAASDVNNSLVSSSKEIDPTAFISQPSVSLETVAVRAIPSPQVQAQKPTLSLTLPQQREQLQSSVDAFRRGDISADELNDEILAFNLSTDKSGVGSEGVLAQLRDDGRVMLSTPERYLPESMRQGPRGEWAERLPIDLSRIPPDVLADLTETHIAEVSASAPGFVVPPSDKQINLAVKLLPKLDADQTATVRSQLSAVQTLALIPNPTEAQQAALLAETTTLATLLEKHDALPSDWSIRRGQVRVHYTRDTAPSYFGHSFGSSKGDNGDQPVYKTFASHTASDQQKVAADLVSAFVDSAAIKSVSHDDVFGYYATQPDGPMQVLQNKLDQAQPIPAGVDLDTMYQSNLVMVQMAVAGTDLKQIEYRSMDVARAALGEATWGLDRRTMYSLYNWIEQDGPAPQSLGRGEWAVVSKEDQEFRDAWDNTPKADRLDYLGIDKEAWDKASPFINQSAVARKARKDAEFGLDDVFKIAVGAFVTYATAGMASGVSGYLSTSVGFSQATAGVVGVTVTAASRAFLTTLITTGDWTSARDAFTGLFEGDVKESLIKIVANKFGVDNRLVDLARADNSEEVLDVFVGDLKDDLIKQFSPALIKGLQSVSPNIVDDFFSDLSTVVKAGAGSEEIAEYAMSWWGMQLSSALNISSVEGVKMVTKLLDGAVSEGKLDVGLMQDLLVNETAKYLGDIPDAVIQRLGGRDSTGAVLAGMGAKFLLDNNFDVDAAKEQLKEYAVSMATDWAEGALNNSSISWVPGAESWSSDFKGLIQAGSNSGWNGDAMQAYLKESPLVQNIIKTYTPEGPAQGKLVAALQYAQANDFDSDKIQQALMTDVFDIVSNAGISKDIADLVGGQDSVMATMTNVFGERLVANDGDIDATLNDLKAYAASYAKGFIGEYAKSVLGT